MIMILNLYLTFYVFVFYTAGEVLDQVETCKDGKTRCSPGFKCVLNKKTKKYSCECKSGYVSYVNPETNKLSCMRKYSKRHPLICAYLKKILGRYRSKR